LLVPIPDNLSMMLSPLLSRLPNGGGFNGPFNGSEDSPRRDGKERPRWVIKHERYYMVGGDLFVLVRSLLAIPFGHDDELHSPRSTTSFSKFIRISSSERPEISSKTLPPTMLPRHPL
jgi:hypothetical protein